MIQLQSRSMRKKIIVTSGGFSIIFIESQDFPYIDSTGMYLMLRLFLCGMQPGIDRCLAIFRSTMASLVFLVSFYVFNTIKFESQDADK